MSNDTTANNIAPYMVASLKLQAKIHKINLRLSLIIFEAECNFGENSEEVALLKRLLQSHLV
jgi:hypothetical protein